MRSVRSFIAVLGRFLAGTATAKEKQVIEKWYSSLDQESGFPELEHDQAEALHRQGFEKIQERIRRRPGRSIKLWPSLAAAAAVLVVGIFSVKYLDVDVSQHHSANPPLSTALLPDREFYNHDSVVREIRLSDSSRILLQPGSSISLATSFNQTERSITLHGEAFFDIKRDEKKPFNVFSYGVVTKVLGTSFTIRAPSEKEHIVVVVKTGRVSVASPERSENGGEMETEVIITPNQQITFDPEKKTLLASLVEKPLPVLTADKIRNEYEGEAISNILSDIERMYGIKINYDVKVLGQCRLTTAFRKEDLYQRLEIITKAIGATYTVKGTQIFVQSNGCQTK